MTGRLDLTFRVQESSDVGAVPVVVEVATANLEPALPARSVRIGQGWHHNMQAGTYLARIRFPSGRMEQRTCTVSDDAQTQVIIDMPNVPGRDRLERPALLRRLEMNDDAPGLQGPAFTSVWARRWRSTANREWLQIEFDGLTVSRDDHTVCYRFWTDDGSNLLQLGGPSINWRLVALPPGLRVDVVISTYGDSELIADVTTESTDSEALFGFMRTGSVESAGVIASTLFDRRPTNTVLAAIGGYYLLRTSNDQKLLSGWASQIAEDFPLFPDGAVINAWHHLKMGRLGGDRAGHNFGVARQQFLLAAERGIPTYTEGLKLLVDGLTLLSVDAGENDPEVSAALQRVLPIAAATDPRSATVTYRGLSPGEPRVEIVMGIPIDSENLVLVQQVQLRDLIYLGLLTPESQLYPNAVLQTTGSLATSGSQREPKDGRPLFARGVADLGDSATEDPALDWEQWQLLTVTPKARRVAARLGVGPRSRPSLDDLRVAAREGPLLPVVAETGLPEFEPETLLAPAVHRRSFGPIDSSRDFNPGDGEAIAPEVPQDRLKDYRNLLDEMPKHNGTNDLVAIGESLVERVAAETLAAAPGSSLMEFEHGPATYLFAQSPTHEPRTVLVVGRPQPPVEQRDARYQREYPLPEYFGGRTVDRGHFLSYSGGGLYGPNLYVKDRALNRGWSHAGRRYRRLEQLAVNAPSSLMWLRPIYIDDSDVPAALDVGVVLRDRVEIETFQNRFDGAAVDGQDVLQVALASATSSQIGHLGEETAAILLASRHEAQIIDIGGAGLERENGRQHLDLVAVINGELVAFDVKTRYNSRSAGRLTRAGNLMRPHLRRVALENEYGLGSRSNVKVFLKDWVDLGEDFAGIEVRVLAVDLVAMLAQQFSVNDAGTKLTPLGMPESCEAEVRKALDGILDHWGL